MDKPKNILTVADRGKLKTLPILTSAKAAEEAKKEIDEGRSGKQLGLRTRWDGFNDLMMGGLRFGSTYLLSGMSGGGKSWILNMIRSDVLNPTLNGSFTKPFKVLHFALEMPASDEVLRTVSGNVQTSYAELISARRKLPDEQYKKVLIELERMKGLEIYYVETTGNVPQIRNTILEFQGKFPQHSILVSIDHTLLADMLNEESEIALVVNESKMFLELRKQIGIMGIIVSQLNDKIEDPQRVNNPKQHYPTKKDIHGSKSVYRDVDCVIVAHDPSQLGITRYGTAREPGDDRQGYRTAGRVFGHILKMRKDNPGIIAWQKDFGRGNLIEDFYVLYDNDRQT